MVTSSNGKPAFVSPTLFTDTSQLQDSYNVCVPVCLKTLLCSCRISWLKVYLHYKNILEIVAVICLTGCPHGGYKPVAVIAVFSFASIFVYTNQKYPSTHHSLMAAQGLLC